jgi:peptide/nickel transport system permease protein
MALVLTFLIYLGMYLTPGDPLTYLISPDALANMNPTQLHAAREALGLNDPFIVRYARWLGGVLIGHFGYSITSGVPITHILAMRLPATLQLSVAALLISSIVGSALGLASALQKGGVADNLLTVAGMLGVSVPQFFLGLVSLLLFAIRLHWLPIGGRIEPGQTGLGDQLRHLVLPAVVLGTAMTAGVMRYARASMLDAGGKDYMKTARSKGLPEWRINLMHGFRVALAPVIVLVGFRLPMLIGGTVVIEQVFQWPGVGSEFVAAVKGQNYPLVMMIALSTVLMVLFASFLIDLLTAALDPRIKLE